MDISATSPPRDEVGVISLIHVAWRYKLLIILVTVLFTGVAVWLAMTATYVYRAETTLTEVTTNGMGDAGSLASRFGSLASLAGVSLGGNGQARESQAVLHSRWLSEEFLRRNKLTPKLMGNAPPSLWLAVDKFRGTVLSFAESKEKGTTTVAMQWRDPKEAAEWANAYVALANEVLRLRALEDSTRNIKYLREQIAKTDVVGVQRVMYELIENETKIHMLANTRTEYAFTVVDPAAVPEQRVWPRRGLIVMSGFAGGVLVGLFLALAVNLFVRYRRETAGQ
jgi:uncharacterized protein involved in exopolysaccharide biosynthesis